MSPLKPASRPKSSRIDRDDDRDSLQTISALSWLIWAMLGWFLMASCEVPLVMYSLFKDGVLFSDGLHSAEIELPQLGSKISPFSEMIFRSAGQQY